MWTIDRSLARDLYGSEGLWEAAQKAHREGDRERLKVLLGIMEHYYPDHPNRETIVRLLRGGKDGNET